MAYAFLLGALYSTTTTRATSRGADLDLVCLSIVGHVRAIKRYPPAPRVTGAYPKLGRRLGWIAPSFACARSHAQVTSPLGLSGDGSSGRL